MKKVIFLVFILFSAHNFAQENKKNLNIKRVSKSPKIDGVFNDEAWKNTEVAKDFVMFRPSSGLPEEENQRTEVRVVYDDEAIYFAAYLYDDKPDEIPTQIANRDNFGVVDWFGIMINPNNDSMNDTEFFIQATGNQADAKSNENDEDFSWSAVWASAVTIVDDGWLVEVKIPYSALRFSNKEVQTWGLNFHRKFANSRNQYTWNFIDRTKGIMQQYSGTLSGIKNIKPPTRLSFTPYASVAYDAYDGDNNFDKSIGLDLKYGISEGFTLDATLIPDFGQTAFDNIVLNLGPFEQRYSEKRPFFTEGLDLFEKGNMFYSRRVGNAPVNMLDDDDLNENEEIIENPNKVNMLNAVKVSGRTSKGLGIGVFNAVTEETYGKIKDTNTGEVKKIVTEPLANYNVLVLDQQFKKNSSVTLVNTNVAREGSIRSANATGFLFNVKDNNNVYFIDGSIKMSHIRENGLSTNGYFFDTSIGDDAGNIEYEVGYKMADENYDINDLGFNRQRDYQELYGRFSYKIFEPTKTFNRYQVSSYSEVRYRKSDGAYTGNYMSVRFNATTLNNFSFGGRANWNIGDQYDYYEPRVEDRYYVDTPRLNLNAFISTDFSKAFAIETSIDKVIAFNNNEKSFELDVSPRYRFNDKFSLNYSLNYENSINEKGYVNELEDGTIIFGERDSNEITNSLAGQYSFSVKSSLSLTFRHYWSPIEYKSQFYELNENGTLSTHPYNENEDINYNIWNLDLSYKWEFAPGSQIVALYRNNIFNEDNFSKLDFYENLENLFGEPSQHNLSLKMIYYIDYNNMKGWLKKKA